jgi:alginate O-acetyltransferase complex protein AlgI
MVFSAFGFVFIFFPAFLLIHYLLKPSARNAFLMLSSLVFYGVGEGARIWILVASVLLNYAAAILISVFQRGRGHRVVARLVLCLAVLANVGMLAYFKYATFVTSNLRALFEHFGCEGAISVYTVALPMGISFFTFQGLSYVVDVYRGVVTAAHNPVTVGTYIVLFPQLVAGPIVRYSDIAVELAHERSISVQRFAQGVTRFSIGFCKKVLLADTLAVVADGVFALPTSLLSFGSAWIGVVSYALQIYLDFSAYSDMAVGMGTMLGFTFPENFDYPYVSRSIREFWRRWHMTLSGWFRDYVYIPLGGSRGGAFRTCLNLIIVFFLTGLWHGASWMFVLWGLWHGAFMLAERVVPRHAARYPVGAFAQHAYVLSVVLVGWLFFRCESVVQVAAFLRCMLGMKGFDILPAREFLPPLYAVVALVSILVATPIRSRILSAMSCSCILRYSVWFIGLMLLIVAMLRVLAGSYSPFLYFRF